jgi:hypothetical protein
VLAGCFVAVVLPVTEHVSDVQEVLAGGGVALSGVSELRSADLKHARGMMNSGLSLFVTTRPALQ